jgi:rhodanese-related sulfurtransferase
MQAISARELQAWLKDSARPSPVLIDVREGWEVEICNLPGAVHMPMQSVPARQEELEPDAPTVVICHHGVRSAQVAAFLERNGFSGLYNLSGGVDAWARDVDPAMNTY